MKTSAGLLIYRRYGDTVEVLLGHPGGPFYTKKDNGVWSIPKGETDKDEELLHAAKREFKEELGFDPPESKNMLELTPAKQTNKVNHIWALEGDVDLGAFKPGTTEINWPPKSHKKLMIEEIDRIQWFELSEARNKLWPAQTPFIDELAKKLDVKIVKTKLLKDLPNQGSFF